MTHRMAPMSAPILVLTLGLLALPPVFAVLAMRGAELLAIPALLLIGTRGAASVPGKRARPR